MEAQYKIQLQGIHLLLVEIDCLTCFSTAQETLIENLNAQLARRGPVHRTDQQVFEILTREEANREMQALQAEANECKKRYRDAEKKLKEKEDEISTLQKSSSYIFLSLSLISSIERNRYFLLFLSQRMTYALSYKQKSSEEKQWRANFNACRLLQHLVLEQ
jgi:hypothetical protein